MAEATERSERAPKGKGSQQSSLLLVEGLGFRVHIGIL